MGEVHCSTDVSKAKSVMGPWLRRDPVANNVALSLLSRQAEEPNGQARFWWATRGDHIAGLALQVGPQRTLHVRVDDLSHIPDLAQMVATQAPDIPGVDGQASAAASFAASWASLAHTPVAISLFDCYYRLDTLIPPPEPASIGGAPRLATIDDLHTTILPWAVAFQNEALPQLPAGPTPKEGDNEMTVDVEGLRAAMVHKIEHQEVSVWDNGHPLAMAIAPTPVEGVSRIHLVYTPPENRGQGLGAAITAAAVQRAMTVGATQCTLFADLANPTSNAIYQRLGFIPVHVGMSIRFGSPDPG